MLPGLTHKEIENLNRILTSKEIESVTKNFSSVCQNEVSQKEKNKYHILIHISGIQRNGADEPIFRAGVDADADTQMCRHSGGGVDWEIGVHVYSLTWV